MEHSRGHSNRRLFQSQTLHRDHRGFKPQAGKKRFRTFAAGTQNPGNVGVVAHHMFDQRPPDSRAPVLPVDHDHRQVTVGQTIGDATGETDNLLAAQCNGSALGVLDELCEMFGGAGAMTPAVPPQKLPCGLDFRRQEVAY